jgi:queuine tRNA-ribosyltransferase
MLLTWHNLRYYCNLMAGLRAAIINGQFEAYAAQVRGRWVSKDAEQEMTKDD